VRHARRLWLHLNAVAAGVLDELDGDVVVAAHLRRGGTRRGPCAAAPAAGKHREHREEGHAPERHLADLVDVDAALELDVSAVGPERPPELFARDHATGPRDQERERAHGLRGEPNWSPVVAQPAGFEVDLEAAETQDGARLLHAPIVPQLARR
jgi:hypothetical protein